MAPSRCIRGLIQLLVVGVGAALVTACGGGDAPKLYPVRGQVLFNEQPAAGAMIVFHPVEATGLMASGKVGADGSFTLNTYPHGDGAPAGEYKVVVTWYPPDARALENAQDKLKGRYADPTQSQLKATVKPEPNELPPFRLKK